ncbi:MAG: hypothetical protein JJT81_05405 [Rubellimicrobium sp.]|nr:hypothetical protein [Rubellimicrobium sp.]
MTLHFTNLTHVRATPGTRPSLTARWVLCPRTGKPVCRWQSDARPEVAAPPQAEAMRIADCTAHAAAARLAALVRRDRDLRAA